MRVKTRTSRNSMPMGLRFHLRRVCGPGQRKEHLRLLDDVMKELDVSWELWNPHPLTHQTLTRRLGWSVMHGMERASGGLGAGHEG